MVEALRNLAAERRTVAPIWLLLMAVSLTASGLHRAEAVAAINSERSLTAAGQYVAVVSSETGIERAGCAALSAAPFVVASGSAALPEIVHLVGGGPLPVQMVDVDVGVLGVFGRTAYDGTSDYQAFIGPSVADELGGPARTVLIREAGVGPIALRVGGVVGTSRNVALQRWILRVVPPTGVSQECWVELHPSHYDASVQILPYLLLTSDGTTREVMFRGEGFISPVDSYRNRASRFVWLFVAGGTFGASIIFGRFRAHDYALYLSLGYRPQDVAIIAQHEQVMVTASATTTGFLVSMLASTLVDVDLVHEIAWIGAVYPTIATLVSSVVGPLVIVLGVRRDLLTALKAAV